MYNGVFLDRDRRMTMAGWLPTEARGRPPELDGRHQAFGDFAAVDDIDLTVPRGSFFALLGPSGCGKTTTLRMIAGLEQPDRRAVLDRRHRRHRHAAHQRPVNTVFQSYALFPHLTVGENVAFGPKRRKGDATPPRGWPTALDLVRWRHFADRKPAQLSGGQQQRVALARALVNHPAVLLLDEPLGALDLKLRREMQVELKRIQTEVGLTFIHVTHDQEEAMTMADTVAVMNKGRIEQLGAPADAVRPAAHRVRRRTSSASPTWRRHRHRDVDGDHARGRRARDAGARSSGRARGARGRGAVRRTAGEAAVSRVGDQERLPARTSRPGAVTRRVVHGRQHAVPGRHPGRRHVRLLRAEPRVGRSTCARRRGLAGLGPRPRVRLCRREVSTTARSTWTTSCEPHERARPGGRRPGREPARRRARGQQRSLDGRTCLLPGLLCSASSSSCRRCAAASSPAVPLPGGFPGYYQPRVQLAELRQRAHPLRPALRAVVLVRRPGDLRWRSSSATRWPTRSRSRPGKLRRACC